MAAAEGWAAGSHELLVAAPTWRAANVLRSEGLDASSIARLLADLDRKVDAGEAPMRPGSVLLSDEAGMVDSATLARLIDHAQAADAKLVLIGDPAQLGEIEAGGLFAAIVRRSEPVVLDEVIRHRHELDREGAKRIREGEGLDIYRSSERVIVVADPEARREEMVNDWWQSFARGEDALMVAKRNAEEAKLNALARERMRAEGRLGEAEIEVGEARFAAGDQVITKISDHKANIYNRERWRIKSVDLESGALVLERNRHPWAGVCRFRAKRAWRARNKRECELAEAGGREQVLMRPITLHECWYTFASLLIDSGANPKAIQLFMGHSKIQTTFDVYGHLLPGSHDEVRKHMDAYLRGNDQL